MRSLLDSSPTPNLTLNYAPWLRAVSSVFSSDGMRGISSREGGTNEAERE
jgi:hypothetical protein